MGLRADAAVLDPGPTLVDGEKTQQADPRAVVGQGPRPDPGRVGQEGPCASPVPVSKSIEPGTRVERRRSMADGTLKTLQRPHGPRRSSSPPAAAGHRHLRGRDVGALRQMARVTGGEAYLAAEPEDVLGVFAQAVLSR